MSDKTKFLLAASFVLLFLQCGFKKVIAQESSAGMSKMNGQIGITTNYVDRGLTQSNKQPSIAAAFDYRFGGGGRLGFEAANVEYPEESARIEMRGFGEYTFVFTSNADLRIRNDWVQYMNGGQRNKTVVLLDQNFFSYHVLFSREDNFEGTKNSRNWFAFQRDWPFWRGTILGTTVGYSMVEGYDSFLDALLKVKYPLGSFNLSLALTYVTNSSQFNGQADPSVYVAVDTKF